MGTRGTFAWPWFGVGAAALGAALGLAPTPAWASGGLFSGPRPVEQSAQRILFEVGTGSLSMTVMMRFGGDAADFAWVLPLREVPLEGSLAVLPRQALEALDEGSSALFQPPPDAECSACSACAVARAPAVADDGLGANAEVRVYVREEIGEYTAAVVGSEDPSALIDWLRAQGYRITAAMLPYIELYTAQGLKFLALKLTGRADVRQLRPFRFGLPGTSPSIPLGLTALAAEPEMSLVVFVLAETRFEGENWPNLEIGSQALRYDPRADAVSTNWATLVAQAVDDAGGRGWVTEFAGPTSGYAERLQAQLDAGGFASPEQAAAAERLLEVLSAHPYLTRLSTRLSAEEMLVDPVLEPSGAGDLPRARPLARFVDGLDQCDDATAGASDPCAFATCGAAGVCRAARSPAGGASELAGCACVPGASARAIAADDGSSTVICQDGRLSFSQAGERDPLTDEVLPDACAGFDCGLEGRCMAINLIPTCVCDQGFVAVADPAAPPGRGLRCVAPSAELPADFYSRSLPALPIERPGGRELPRGASAAYPMPRRPREAAVSVYGGGCGLGPAEPAGPWLLGLLLASCRARRRRRCPGTSGTSGASGASGTSGTSGAAHGPGHAALPPASSSGR